LNRKIDDLLSDAGFQIDRLTTGYIPGPKIMTFFRNAAVTPLGVAMFGGRREMARSSCKGALNLWRVPWLTERALMI
jgi:hypothetical protein